MDIPPPIRDSIQGHLVRPKETAHLLLVLGENPAITFPHDSLAKGHITLSYAFALYFNEDALLPQFVLDDFRRSYTGMDAIRFLLHKGDTYPRADVIGVGATTGKRREHYLKEVDLGTPMKIAAYGDGTLTNYFGYLDVVVKVDDNQVPSSWQDIKSEIDLPLVARFVPCIQVNPGSLFAVITDLLNS